MRVLLSVAVVVFGLPLLAACEGEPPIKIKGVGDDDAQVLGNACKGDIQGKRGYEGGIRIEAGDALIRRQRSKTGRNMVGEIRWKVTPLDADIKKPFVHYANCKISLSAGEGKAAANCTCEMER